MSDDSAFPTVLSSTTLSNGFLGKLIEICFVTADHRRTMEEPGASRHRTLAGVHLRLDDGHGPYLPRRGRGLRDQVCFADVGDLAVEIMQPLYGPSIFQEFLDTRGEGIQHVAFDCEEKPWGSGRTNSSGGASR